MTSHSAAASALFFSTLVLLLLAGTAGSTSNGDAVSGNVTATITSGSNSSSGTVPVVNNGVDMYTCYLCSGRNPLMIHWCPIYWDECHLNCEETTSAATVAVRDARSGPVSPAVLPGETMLDRDPGDYDECYVMKLYKNGRYVIVADLNCGQVKSCVLTCGGGEVLDTGNVRPATAAAPVPVAAAFQHPRRANFHRCGDMVRRSGDRSGRKR